MTFPKPSLGLLLTATLAAVALPAHSESSSSSSSSSCTSSSYNSMMGGYNDSFDGNQCNPEAPAPAAVVTSQVLQNVVSRQIVAQIGTRIQNVRRAAPSAKVVSNGGQFGTVTGLAGGDSAPRFGFWGTYQYSGFDQEAVGTQASFTGDSHSGGVGFDFSPMEGLLIGAAVFGEGTQVDLLVSANNNAGEFEQTGFTIAPYASYGFNDIFSVDVSGGYSNLEADQFRTVLNVNTGGQENLLSSVDSDRYFVAANLNALVPYGNWTFGGQAGYLHIEEEADAYVETFSVTRGTQNQAGRTTELGQIRIGGDASYSFDIWEPYMRVHYVNDVDEVAGTVDDDEVRLGGGMRFYHGAFTGSFDVGTTLGRANFSEHNFTVNARYTW